MLTLFSKIDTGVSILIRRIYVTVLGQLPQSKIATQRKP